MLNTPKKSKLLVAKEVVTATSVSKIRTTVRHIKEKKDISQLLKFM